MAREVADRYQTRQPPRWVVAVVILLTGMVTAVAAYKSGLRGPQVSWETATQAVTQIWADPAAQAQSAQAMQAQQNQALQNPMAAQQPAVVDSNQMSASTAVPPATVPEPPAVAPDTMGPRTVAGLPGVPLIRSGAQRPHPDRGPCTNCHTVLDDDGAAVPAIHSFSVMPHGYRGVCSNCHQITVGLGPTGNPVAGLQIQSAPSTNSLPPSAASWRGLEVTQNDQGLYVASATGDAAQVGIQAGDKLSSINGQPLALLEEFTLMTEHGQLLQAALVIERNGQRMAFVIQSSPGG